MDKELSLIFDYANAPDDLKNKAKDHRRNSVALARAQTNNVTAANKLKEAQTAWDDSNKAFREALKAWTPATPGGE